MFGNRVFETNIYLAYTPPWLVDDQEKWCNESFFIDAEVEESYKFSLGKIMEGRADVGNCFEPWNAVNFDVKKQVFEARDDRYGLFIQFEDNVETILSDIAISPTTLITRISGLIGVGK